MNQNDSKQLNLDENFYKLFYIFNIILFITWIILFIYTRIFRKKKEKLRQKMIKYSINQDDYNIKRRSNTDMKLETLLNKVDIHEENIPRTEPESKNERGNYILSNS